MAVRLRSDGRVLCAAMHPAALGDVYLHDGISYLLTVETRALVTDQHHLRYSDGSVGHGQWWWASEVPSEVQVESHDVTKCMEVQ